MAEEKNSLNTKSITVKRHSTADQQTLKDLEFDKITALLVGFCWSDTAREELQNLMPFSRPEPALKSLDESHELAYIRGAESGFPRLEFEELKSEIKRLGTPGSTLGHESFLRLRHASELCNELLHFFQKRNEDFPALCQVLAPIYSTKDIVSAVDKVMDKRGNVKDDASAALGKIRQEMRNVKRKINKNFSSILKKLHAKGYLADTSEAYLDDRRVLSVISTHKRSVDGSVLGSSKTGSLTYIEPRENAPLNSELEMLKNDEQKEIMRIFRELTEEVRILLPLVKGYQKVLIAFDIIQAKTRLGIRLGGVRPALSDESKIELINAYHPLLKLANEGEKKKTLPQTLIMDKLSRLLVISGPNAGGKSITLKTVGLLQLMFQSGLMIPADGNSKLSWFQQIGSDIGDNQSILNQLSTYSYRLKRMKHFLEIANRKTLLLLDEFGTGSDPDLGGALSEVFFETLYNKRIFGVLTTHYSNIKLKAAKLKNAVNASMLFDTTSLEPLYQLSIGQPGSSFTFEVAQINGIPLELIEEAKGKMDGKKVEMDKLLSEVQQEKSRLQKVVKQSEEAERAARKAESDFKAREEKYIDRLTRQQTTLDRNNKFLSNGKKMSQFIQSYDLRTRNKNLLEDVKKFLAVEKTKIADAKKTKELKEKALVKAGKKKPKKQKDAERIAVGSTVKLQKSKQIGEVLAIDGKIATVAFGNFRTKVELDKLIFIQ